MNNSSENNPILEAARKNKNKSKELENNEEKRGAFLSISISSLLGIVLFFIEYLKNKTWNFGILSVLFVTCGIWYLYSGIKSKSVNRIVFGFIGILASLVFIVIFLIRVMI